MGLFVCGAPALEGELISSRRERLVRFIRAIPWPVKALMILLVLVGATVVTLNLPPVTRALGQYVAEVASTKSGMTVRIDAAHLLPSGVRLDHLAVERRGRPLVSFDQFYVRPRLSPLLNGHIQVSSVEGHGMALYLPPRDEEEPSGGAGAVKKEGPSVREKVAALLDPGGFEARVVGGQVVWGGASSPRLVVPLEQARFSWPAPGQFPVKGSVQLGVPRGEGGITLEAETRGEGVGATLHVSGPGFPLEVFRPHLLELAPIDQLERLSAALEKIPQLPSIGGDFKLELDRQAKLATVQGRVAVNGVVVQDERLATVPVGPIDFTQEVSLALYLEGPRLVIDRWDGRVNKARYQLESSVLERTPEGPELYLTLLVNQTPYQDVVASVPPGLAPALEGVRIGGSLDLRLHLEGSLGDLTKLTPEFNADWSRVRLEQPSKQLHGEHPLDGFKYVPYRKDDKHFEFTLGRGEPGWVPLGQVPRYLIDALLLSEDINFYQHEGFDEEGLKKAVRDNLKAGRAVRGGSTITQQLAKNLFLNRDKTAIRKLQEAVLAWELEQVLKKSEILEVYLNIIEWGPDIYGIGRAAQHYFGKHPSELTIKEAAYLCTIIPNPIRYHLYFERGELTERWIRHLQNLIDRMRAFERLSEEEYWLATDEPLYFRGSPRSAVDLSQMELEDEAERAAQEGEGGFLFGAPPGEVQLTQPVEPPPPQ